jgi:hypothetical protein
MTAREVVAAMALAAEVVDIGGIAELAGVPYETAMTWRRRARARLNPPASPRHRPLPEPAGYVSGNPWWWRADVIRWLTDTGRLQPAPS